MRHKVALRQGVAMVRFDVLGDRRVSVNRGDLIAAWFYDNQERVALPLLPSEPRPAAPTHPALLTPSAWRARAPQPA